MAKMAFKFMKLDVRLGHQVCTAQPVAGFYKLGPARPSSLELDGLAIKF
jgi:hypothetical protein